MLTVAGTNVSPTPDNTMAAQAEKDNVDKSGTTIVTAGSKSQLSALDETLEG
jgi:hypothetical protein